MEHRGENEERKECGQKAQAIGCLTKVRADRRVLEKKEKETYGKRSKTENLMDHIAVENRLVATLGLLLHIGEKRRFARKGKTAERIHDDIDPKHLYYGDGGADADERTDHRNPHRTKIHRQLKGNKFANALENGSAV